MVRMMEVILEEKEKIEGEVGLIEAGAEEEVQRRGRGRSERRMWMCPSIIISSSNA